MYKLLIIKHLECIKPVSTNSSTMSKIYSLKFLPIGLKTIDDVFLYNLNYDSVKDIFTSEHTISYETYSELQHECKRLANKRYMVNI